MAFKLDNLVIDKIAYGIAESLDGDLLYAMTQLADASIEVTSESKEARDKDGVLIRKFYTGKSGTFTANNAMIDLNIIASASGNDKEIASDINVIKMPFVKTVKAGEATTVTVAGLVDSTVSVIGISASGNKVAEYSQDTTASVTAFSVATSTGVVTLPTTPDEDVVEFIVKAERNVKSGAKVVNEADKFPTTIKLTLVALAIDACTPDVVRKVYIVMPSFQPSPDMTISLTTDTQLEYKGDLQVSYCGASGKVLFEVYVAEDDID